MILHLSSERLFLYFFKTILKPAKLDYVEETDDLDRNPVFVTSEEVEIVLTDLFSMYNIYYVQQLTLFECTTGNFVCMNR